MKASEKRLLRRQMAMIEKKEKKISLIPG